jgi:hypothetical protein
VQRCFSRVITTLCIEEYLRSLTLHQSIAYSVSAITRPRDQNVLRERDVSTFQVSMYYGCKLWKSHDEERTPNTSHVSARVRHATLRDDEPPRRSKAHYNAIELRQLSFPTPTGRCHHNRFDSSCKITYDIPLKPLKIAFYSGLLMTRIAWKCSFHKRISTRGNIPRNYYEPSKQINNKNLDTKKGG